MYLQAETSTVQWIELAYLLEVEFRGEPIDRARARQLAASLLPRFPELTCTLTHIQRRLAA
jgi:hypothetical protein